MDLISGDIKARVVEPMISDWDWVGEQEGKM